MSHCHMSPLAFLTISLVVNKINCFHVCISCVIDSRHQNIYGNLIIQDFKPFFGDTIFSLTSIHSIFKSLSTTTLISLPKYNPQNTAIPTPWETPSNPTHYLEGQKSRPWNHPFDTSDHAHLLPRPPRHLTNHPRRHVTSFSFLSGDYDRFLARGTLKSRRKGRNRLVTAGTRDRKGNAGAHLPLSPRRCQTSIICF